MAMWDFGGCACGLSRYCDCSLQTDEDRENIRKQKESMVNLEKSDLLKKKKDIDDRLSELEKPAELNLTDMQDLAAKMTEEMNMSPRHPSAFPGFEYDTGKDIEDDGFITSVPEVPNSSLPGYTEYMNETLPMSISTTEEVLSGKATGRGEDFPALKGEEMLHKKLTVKDTNPKDAVGTKKSPMSVVPMGVMMEVGVGMLEGARKYGRHNYRVAGVRASVYVDATMRHLMKFWDFGLDIDKDSGLSEVTKAITSLVVLRDAMMTGKWVDDRPPPLPVELLDQIQRSVDEVFERHPNALPAYTHEDVVKTQEEK